MCSKSERNKQNHQSKISIYENFLVTNTDSCISELSKSHHIKFCILTLAYHILETDQQNVGTIPMILSISKLTKHTMCYWAISIVLLLQNITTDFSHMNNTFLWCLWVTPSSNYVQANRKKNQSKILENSLLKFSVIRPALTFMHFSVNGSKATELLKYNQSLKVIMHELLFNYHK